MRLKVKYTQKVVKLAETQKRDEIRFRDSGAFDALAPHGCFFHCGLLSF